jgi:hypothetical protein
VESIKRPSPRSINSSQPPRPQSSFPWVWVVLGGVAVAVLVIMAVIVVRYKRSKAQPVGTDLVASQNQPPPSSSLTAEQRRHQEQQQIEDEIRKRQRKEAAIEKLAEDRRAKKRAEKQKENSCAVSYRTLPGPGRLTIILIDPKHRREKDMRELGDQLCKDFTKDKFVWAIVYDDEKAAKMCKDAINDRLSKSDLAFYDQHMIGIYNRNLTKSYHAFQILLEGIDGPSIDITYET